MSFVIRILCLFLVSAGVARAETLSIEAKSVLYRVPVTDWRGLPDRNYTSVTAGADGATYTARIVVAPGGIGPKRFADTVVTTRLKDGVSTSETHHATCLAPDRSSNLFALKLIASPEGGVVAVFSGQCEAPDGSYQQGFVAAITWDPDRALSVQTPLLGLRDLYTPSLAVGIFDGELVVAATMQARSKPSGNLMFVRAPLGGVPTIRRTLRFQVSTGWYDMRFGTMADGSLFLVEPWSTSTRLLGIDAAGNVVRQVAPLRHSCPAPAGAALPVSDWRNDTDTIVSRPGEAPVILRTLYQTDQQRRSWVRLVAQIPASTTQKGECRIIYEKIMERRDPGAYGWLQANDYDVTVEADGARFMIVDRYVTTDTKATWTKRLLYFEIDKVGTVRRTASLDLKRLSLSPNQGHVEGLITMLPAATTDALRAAVPVLSWSSTDHAVLDVTMKVTP